MIWPATTSTSLVRVDVAGLAVRTVGTVGARVDRLATECGAVVLPGLRTAQLPVRRSAREREIFTLAAKGLTNKAIAAALTMSVRTVERHIYRACTRLGLSRAELVALIVDPGSAGMG